MSKRVLIVGYFHVDANMGGVRLRRIARLLPRHGWEPVVLTHQRDVNSPANPQDGVRLEEVAAPNLTKIFSKVRRALGEKPVDAPASGGEPKAMAIGLTTTINRWLMIPDKHKLWYSRAVRRGRELLRGEKFDAIFASLEPRTALLVATRLARESGVPCVIEYRDLWTGSPYELLAQPTPWHRWMHSRLERRILGRAQRVSAVCKGIADYLSKRYANLLRDPVELNYNFFDPEEYPRDAARPSPEQPFVISYTGGMYTGRSPLQFFEGMRLFIEQSGLTPQQFRFRWAGAAYGIDDLAEVLDRTGVRPYLDFLGMVPHREALRLLLASDAALILQGPGDAIHIPGKLFEALGARVPLLALALPCEVTDIITRCGGGVICPHTRESVAAGLAEFYRLHQKGARWQFNETEVQRFSADASVGRLAALFSQASG